MVAFEKTGKVSSKGQITLPKRAREALRSQVVRIVVEDDDSVRIEAVGELAGSLSAYASGKARRWPAARDQAWSEAIHEKHGRR